MIKIGLIGTGFMGSTHNSIYQLLSERLDVKLTAVADINPERGEKAAALHGAEYFSDAGQLIKSGIDVVDICLPTYLHSKYAAMAMDAGLDVFMEKPAVLTIDDGAMLLQKQRETGRKVMVGQCIRFWPEYAFLKKAYDEHTYGSLKSLVLKRISPLPTYGWNNWYLDEKKAGGAFLDLHIHDADFARYLLGEPDEVTAKGDREHIFSLYQYNSGVTVQLEGGWDYPASLPFCMEYRADFEHAALVFSGKGVTVYSGDTSTFEECRNIEAGLGLGGNLSEGFTAGAYYNELYYFYHCLSNGIEPDIATLSEAVKSVGLVYRELENTGKQGTIL